MDLKGWWLKDFVVLKTTSNKAVVRKGGRPPPFIVMWQYTVRGVDYQSGQTLPVP